MKRAYALIDLAKYYQNISQIRAQIPSTTQLMAIIKADAYGHGAVRIANTALQAKANYLGVAWLSEAVELRSNGIKTPILLLSEPVSDFSTEIVGMSITQTVYTHAFVDKLQEKAKLLRRKAKVHIKVDTGMGRIGCTASEVLPLLRHIQNLDHIEVEGIFTHFANADKSDLDYTKNQFNLFMAVLNTVSQAGFRIPIRHAANSDAVQNFPQASLDMVRTGISTYDQVLSLKTCVGYIKKVPANTYISYGSEYQTPKETAIATIMIGYADGIPRELGGKGRVLINGKSFPMVGRVCMDMLMVDLGEDSSIRIGDEAVLIGRSGTEQITTTEISTITHKIPYEIMCGISKRVPRLYLKNSL